MTTDYSREIRSGAFVSIDCLSFCRNSLYTRNIACPTAKIGLTALPFLTALQGSIVVGVGAERVYTSKQALTRALSHNDQKGVAHSCVGFGVGLCQMTTGTSAITGSIGTIAHSTAAALASTVIAPALIATNGFFIAKSALTLLHVHQLEKDLPTTRSELKKFLTEQHPENLKRILGEKCFAEIQRFLATPDHAKFNTSQLRTNILRECFKQKITAYSVIFVSIIGLTATILGLLCASSCPILSPILYTIGAATWIFIDLAPLQDKIREFGANKKYGTHVSALPESELCLRIRISN